MEVGRACLGYAFFSFYLAAPGLRCSTWDLQLWYVGSRPWPGITPGPPAWGAPSLSHWTTRKVTCAFWFKEGKAHLLLKSHIKLSHTAYVDIYKSICSNNFQIQDICCLSKLLFVKNGFGLFFRSLGKSTSFVQRSPYRQKFFAVDENSSSIIPIVKT